MSLLQQVIWFDTLKDAEVFEAKLYAQALANGQKCARWAEIIEAPEGYGVAVKDRVLHAVSIAERSRIKNGTPPDTGRITS